MNVMEFLDGLDWTPEVGAVSSAVAELITAATEYRAAIDGPLDDPMWLELVARYGEEGKDDADMVLAGVRERIGRALAAVGVVA